MYRTADAHPPIDCPIFDEEAGISGMSVYSDWMHDKYLGTDKVMTHNPPMNYDLERDLYRHIYIYMYRD